MHTLSQEALEGQLSANKLLVLSQSEGLSLVQNPDVRGWVAGGPGAESTTYRLNDILAEQLSLWLTADRTSQVTILIERLDVGGTAPILNEVMTALIPGLHECKAGRAVLFSPKESERLAAVMFMVLYYEWVLWAWSVHYDRACFIHGGHAYCLTLGDEPRCHAPVPWEEASQELLAPLRR